jgi:predicted CopG family antitoxin
MTKTNKNYKNICVDYSVYERLQNMKIYPSQSFNSLLHYFLVEKNKKGGSKK